MARSELWHDRFEPDTDAMYSRYSRLVPALLGAFLSWPAGAASAAPGPIGFAAVDADGLETTTGGEGGPIVTVSTLDELERVATADLPCVIRVSGTISGSGMLRLGSHKTLSGGGPDSVLEGFGINLSGVQNVIVRNLSFRGADDDAINVQSFAHHIWIHHCDFEDAYDGLVDIKRGSSWITVSWNHFSRHGKTCLLGHSDGNGEQDRGRLKVSYHHNWFDGTNSRHPRVRFGECHVFNNLYDGVTGYGVASTEDADVLVEANYFLNVTRPTLVGYAASGPGDLIERDNAFVSSGAPQTAGSVFDPSSYYSYRADPAADVPSIVRAGAGVSGFSPPTGAFRRGDCNSDGGIDVADPVALLFAIFTDRFDIGCDDACDANDDGAVDVSDAVASLEAIFLARGGIPPPSDCGLDPGSDGIGCAQGGCP